MDQSEERVRPLVSRRHPDDDPAWPAWLSGLKVRMAHLPIRQTDPRSPVLEAAIVFKGNLCNQIFSKLWGPAGGKRIFKPYALE